MKHLLLALTAAFTLAACANDPNAPQLGLGIGIGPNGLRVSPKVTTKVGDARVGVGPGGASVGTSVGGVGVSAGL